MRLLTLLILFTLAPQASFGFYNDSNDDNPVDFFYDNYDEEDEVTFRKKMLNDILSRQTARPSKPGHCSKYFKYKKNHRHQKRPKRSFVTRNGSTTFHR